MSGVIELRVYCLKPGVRDAFEQRFEEAIRPMLERRGIKVLAAVPSLHDEQGFTLVRAFASVEQREAQLADFYNSIEWRMQHSAAVTDMIEQYDTCVVDAGRLAEAIANR